jgi:hypothetical protein
MVRDCIFNVLGVSKGMFDLNAQYQTALMTSFSDKKMKQLISVLHTKGIQFDAIYSRAKELR